MYVLNYVDIIVCIICLAQDRGLDPIVGIQEVDQDLVLDRIVLNQNLEVFLAVTQDLGQAVDHSLAAVLHQAVVLVLVVGLLHVVAQSRVVDQDLALLVVLNRALNLAVNQSQYQDHQHVLNPVVVLLPVLLLVLEVDLHLIRLQDPNLVADLLLDPGTCTVFILKIFCF